MIHTSIVVLRQSGANSSLKRSPYASIPSCHDGGNLLVQPVRLRFPLSPSRIGPSPSPSPADIAEAGRLKSAISPSSRSAGFTGDDGGRYGLAKLDRGRLSGEVWPVAS